MRARYAISNEDVIQENIRCYCQRKMQGNVCVDVYGEHFVSGCLYYGSRQSIHDRVKYAVFECIDAAELPAMLVEDKNVLQDNGHDGLHRADISMKLPINNMGLRDCFVDVTVGNILDGVVNGTLIVPSIQDSTNGRKAHIRFLQKQSKYDDIMQDTAVELRIVALETTGRMHPASEKFINQLAEIAAHKRKIDVNTMRRYMFMKISVALFTGIGSVVHRRIGAVNDYRSAALDDYQRENDLIRQLAARD